MRRLALPLTLALGLLLLVGVAFLRERMSHKAAPEAPKAPSTGTPGDPSPPVDGTSPDRLLGWSDLDIEGRWLMIRSLDPASAEAQELLTRIVEEEDWELLEWLAIYPWFVGDNEAAERMTTTQPPNLIRVAAWSLESPDSHRMGWGYTVLTAKAPALARAWLRLHPDAVDAGLKATLDKMALDDVSAEGQLPPLEAKEVLRHLDAPRHLATLEAGRRADPDVTYVHQVLRAIDGLAAFERLRDQDPWAGKLRRLTEHPHPQVRQAAYLAYARIPAAERRWLLQRSEDRDETDEVRSAALLGYSFGTDPRVYLELLGISLDDPRAAAAWSRLGDLDHGFALELLPDPARAEEPAELSALLADTRTRITGRAAAPPDTATHIQMLDRLRAAESASHPLASRMRSWTVALLARSFTGPDALANLQALADAYPELGPILTEIKSHR